MADGVRGERRSPARRPVALVAMGDGRGAQARSDSAGMTGDIMCRYHGRDFTAGEMALLRALIAGPAALNRHALSKEFCRRIGWFKPDGGLKDMMARVTMLAMHKDGLIVTVRSCRYFGPEVAVARRSVRPVPDRACGSASVRANRVAMGFQCPTPFLTLAITPLRSASIAIWQVLRTAPYRHDRTVTPDHPAAAEVAAEPARADHLRTGHRTAAVPGADNP